MRQPWLRTLQGSSGCLRPRQGDAKHSSPEGYGRAGALYYVLAVDQSQKQLMHAADEVSASTLFTSALSPGPAHMQQALCTAFKQGCTWPKQLCSILHCPGITADTPIQASTRLCWPWAQLASHNASAPIAVTHHAHT